MTQGRILRDSAPTSLVLPNAKKKTIQGHRDPDVVRLLKRWISEFLFYFFFNLWIYESYFIYGSMSYYYLYFYFFSLFSMLQCYKVSKLRDEQLKIKHRGHRVIPALQCILKYKEKYSQNTNYYIACCRVHTFHLERPYH